MPAGAPGEVTRRPGAQLAQPWLTALDRIPATVIHGDLFGENILVDEAVRPTAVLDFGFRASAACRGPDGHSVTFGCPAPATVIHTVCRSLSMA
jgi:hypothetical protein